MPAIQVKELTTADEVFANYRAVRARMRALRAWTPPPVLVEVIEPEPIPEPVIAEPLPILVDVPAEPPVKTARDILGEVAAKHDLTMMDLRSRGRQRRLVEARKEFAYRALTETMLSMPQIGHVLCRDHTVVLYLAATYCFWNGLPQPRGAEWSITKILRSKAARNLMSAA